MAQFDSKAFNAEAFGKYVEKLPNPNRDELIKSGAVIPSAEIKNLLGTQTGSAYGTIPMFGRIDGTALNYDGNTNISATSVETFSRSVVAIGRAKGWVERDFSVDVTAGVDFMSEVGKQTTEYWDTVNTGLLLSILKGIFSMTGAKNLEFVNNHTSDVKNEVVDATTLNTAIQKACGDKKSKFSMVIMHSAVATNLENLNLLNYLKQTDASGIQRDLALATWNGKAVLIDDGMPATEGYFDATSSTVGALKVVASGASTGEINLADATPYFGSKTLAADDYVIAGTQYTTYALGNGAFEYADLGADVPYEMHRDPATYGGQTTLFNRERLAYAPYGISYKKASQASSSPTNAELETGANWELATNGKSSTALTVFNHKDIPIARIKSRG